MYSSSSHRVKVKFIPFVCVWTSWEGKKKHSQNSKVHSKLWYGRKLHNLKYTHLTPNTFYVFSTSCVCNIEQRYKIFCPGWVYEYKKGCSACILPWTATILLFKKKILTFKRGSVMLVCEGGYISETLVCRKLYMEEYGFGFI